MAVVLRLAVVGVLGTLVCVCASTASRAQRFDVGIEDHIQNHTDRVLTGVSRRKYLPNDGNALATYSSSNSSIDDDDDYEDDDDDDDEDDEDLDDRNFNVSHGGSAVKAHIPVGIDSPNSVPKSSNAHVDGKHVSLLMSSLPAPSPSASASPASAKDVIESHLGSLYESFYRVMNEFFANIDRELEKNRALPLLEHGDAFF